MAILPTIFIESTLNGAKEHGVQVHTLPANQGLILFPIDIAVSEQCVLLEQIAGELRTAQTLPEPQEQQIKTTQCSSESVIDCQVTVEERAQLFKFLTG